MKNKLLFIFVILLTVILSGCKTNSIEGSWELSKNSDNECPVYYKFKTVVKKEKKETIVNHIVEMYTDNNKEKLYQGTYVKNSNIYSIDYGDSFTSNQSMKIIDGNLEIHFESVNKLCTYKKNNR